jgi:hypothetical protein
MEKNLFFTRGGLIRTQVDESGPPLAPFPVCLAIRFGEDVRAECPDFLLDDRALWVFVRTDAPLPLGTAVVLHFYIPPENKLLAELEGRVGPGDRDTAPFPAGMFVHVDESYRETIEVLIRYFEQKKPLVDKTA